jgi:predicted alpha/beta superfamily hydrolase
MRPTALPAALCLLVLATVALAGRAGAAEPAARPHTANANVHVIAPPMTIPGLDRQRTIRVYLPPGYADGKARYPVLYMHDGQNLFDDATSYVGEWGVDEAMDALAKEGLPLIVVGIDHGGEKRFNELTAWPNPRFGAAEGAAYMEFVVKVLKPWVDRTYRTRPGRRDTGIMGSSMGGVASHYAIYQYPEVFSKAGIFSPAYWVADPAVFEWTAKRRLGKHSRLYFIAGGKEGDDMVRPFDPMVAQVRKAAGKRAAVHAELIPSGEHNERFWRGEFPKAIRFLYGKD